MGIFSRDKMIAELLQSRCLWEYALNCPAISSLHQRRTTVLHKHKAGLQ